MARIGLNYRFSNPVVAKYRSLRTNRFLKAPASAGAFCFGLRCGGETGERRQACGSADSWVIVSFGGTRIPMCMR